MKMRSLIFGIAVLVSAALIFSGCETETTTETVTVNKGAAADLDALQKLLDTEGVNEVVYYGDLEIGTGTLVIPAGKTVTVKDGGVTLSTGILGVVGTLMLPEGKSIDVSGAGVVAGSETLLALVAGDSVVKANLYNSISAATAAFSAAENPATAAALVDVAGGDLTATAVPSGKTLYVLGKVTIGSTAPAAAGSVSALGKLLFDSTVDISSYPNTFTYTGATFETSATVTVTLPATAAIAAIDVTGEGAFTVAGAATSLTVTKLTGKLVLPGTLGALTISGGNGNVTVPAGTFSGAAKFGNTGDTTFSETATFSDTVEFGGDVVLTAAKAITLASGKALTLAGNKSVKVGESVILTADGSTVLTPGGASTLTYTDSKLSLGGAALTLTSGELSVAEDAELELAKDLTLETTTTISNAGTITLGADGSLLLNGADSNGAKLTGTGKLVAALTEITGEWQAGSIAGSLTIKAGTGTESTIAGSESVLTAGPGGKITQKAGDGNNLTIAGSTTVALGGDATTPIGSIVLTTAAKGGQITLADGAIISGSIATSEDTSVAAGSVSIEGVIVAGSISGGTLSAESKTLGFLAGSASLNTLVGTISATESTVTINAATIISK
jgi:hypothetical protein